MITHFRQRPPVFITAVFAFTVALCYIFEPCFANTGILIAALACCIAASAVFFARKFIYIGLLVLTAAMVPLGILLVNWCYETENFARSLAERNVSVRGRVYDVYDEDERAVYYVEVLKVSGRKVRSFNITVNADSREKAPLLYDVALFNVNTYDFHEGLYDDTYREIYRSKGVFLRCYGEYLRTEKQAEGGYLILRNVRNFFDEAFVYVKNSAFLKALVIGDRNRLSSEDFKLFSQAGVSHVLALSGLHISVILLSLNTVLELFSARKKIYIVSATATVLFYMALTGFSHSVVRAGIMAIFSMAAELLHNRGDSVDSVCVALFIILLRDPYAIGSVSLQLSFLATLGIILLAAPLMRKIKKRFSKIVYKNHFSKLYRYFFGALATILTPVVVTAAVLLFGFPIMLVSFNGVSSTALLSNVAVVPQVSAVIVAALIYVAVYAIVPIRAAATHFLKYVLDLQSDAIYRTVKIFAELKTPQLWVKPEHQIVFALIFAAAMILLLLFDAKLKYYIVLPSLVAVFCVITVFYAYTKPQYEIYCLRTEKSEAVVFMYDGETVIYNAGGTSSVVTEFCERNNIYDIKAVIAALPDENYREYFDDIYNAGIEIEYVYHTSFYYDGEREYYLANLTEPREYEYNEEFSVGNVKFEVNPRHENSCFLRAKLADTDFAYNVNATANRTRMPPYLYDSDIVVMSGETDIFYDEPLIEPQYFLYEFSKYSDFFKSVYNGDNVYDLNAARIYVFGINDGKISMRSMSHGIQ